jgi:hypothetical protein
VIFPPFLQKFDAMEEKPMRELTSGRMEIMGGGVGPGAGAAALRSPNTATALQSSASSLQPAAASSPDLAAKWNPTTEARISALYNPLSDSIKRGTKPVSLRLRRYDAVLCGISSTLLQPK